MLAYIVRRFLIIIPLLVLISIIVFIVIQLPPGDYLTTYISSLRASGVELDEREIEGLIRQYGLDRSVTEQYFIWVG
ncbi:MAG: ABC transporter permease, partial [Spirochaetaceae bacterium]